MLEEKKYNLNAIKSVSRNNTTLFNNMILLFIENSLNEINNLEKSILNNDIEKTRDTIHKIKPSFAYLGLNKLIDDLSEIRNALIDNNIEKSKLLFFEFKIKLEKIITELKTELINV